MMRPRPEHHRALPPVRERPIDGLVKLPALALERGARPGLLHGRKLPVMLQAPGWPGDAPSWRGARAKARSARCALRDPEPSPGPNDKAGAQERRPAGPCRIVPLHAVLAHRARHFLPALLALLAPWGCSSTPSADSMAEDRWKAIPPLSYVIGVTLPGSLREEAGPEGPPQGILRLDPDRIEKSIASAFRELRVSTDVQVVTAADAESSAGGSGPLEGIAAGADLLLEIDPSGPPTYDFSYRNGWFLPNTFLWFLAGFPSFWIADRVYAVRWDLTLKVSRPCARGQPQTIRLSLDKDQAMSVSEQGWTARALYTPPGFYEGPQAARVLTEQVEGWLVEEIVAFLKSEGGKPEVLSLLSDVEIHIESPENFATVRPGEAVLAASIESPTLLERLRIEVDGEPALEKSPLNMPKASRRAPARGLDRRALEYRLRVPLQGGPGEHLVRVFALRSGEPAALGAAPGRGWSASRSIRFTVSKGNGAREVTPAGEVAGTGEKTARQLR